MIIIKKMGNKARLEEEIHQIDIDEEEWKEVGRIMGWFHEYKDEIKRINDSARKAGRFDEPYDQKY